MKALVDMTMSMPPAKEMMVLTTSSTRLGYSSHRRPQQP
jgi:hypothetical protein